MSNKKKSTKKQKIRDRPEQFQTYAECVRWNKKSVYLIARGRKMGDKTEWTTLGSGFLAAPNRLVTASHVINDPTKKNPKALHKEGDAYYLLRRDDEDNVHVHVYPYALNKSLFVYPAEDISIFHLEDSFYELNGHAFAKKEEYIPISKGFCAIGTEIGILGYPISALQFEGGDFNRPKISNILLRTDQGVVNCRYQTAERVFAYQFTLSFNPGNSGGPIFNSKTGRAVSIVKGFNTILLMAKGREGGSRARRKPAGNSRTCSCNIFNWIRYPNFSGNIQKTWGIVTRSYQEKPRFKSPSKAPRPMVLFLQCHSRAGGNDAL